MSTSNEHMPVAPPEQPVEQPLGLGELSPVGAQAVPVAPVWMDAALALALWLLSIFLIVFVANLIPLPYILFRYRGVQLTQQVLTSDPTILFLSVLGVLPAHVLTFGAAWLLVTRNGKRPFWRTLNWSWTRRLELMDYVAIVWGFSFLAVVLYVVSGFVTKLIGGGEPTDIEMLVKSSAATRITLAVLATATGPLVEEVIYRGVLYPAVQKVLGAVWSVVIVSFLFTFVHVFQYRNNWGVITAIAILSVTLTLTRAISGRLLPCFIIHMVFNGIQSLIILFHPYLEQMEKGAGQKTGLVLSACGQLFGHLL